MSACGDTLHDEHLRIVGAQAHGTTQVLDRDLRLTEPDLHQAAEEPCQCQIRIEHDSPIGEGSAVVEVANDKCEDHPGCAEHNSVISAQLCRPPREPCTLGDL